MPSTLFWEGGNGTGDLHNKLIYAIALYFGGGLPDMTNLWEGGDGTGRLHDKLIRQIMTSGGGAGVTPAELQTALDSLDDYEAIAFSAAGDSEITLAADCKLISVFATVGVGAGAYIHNIDLGTAGNAGDKACVVLLMPASTNPTVNIRDNTTPTTLWTEVGSGGAYTRQLWFTWSGTVWESEQS